MGGNKGMLKLLILIVCYILVQVVAQNEMSWSDQTDVGRGVFIQPYSVSVVKDYLIVGDYETGRVMAFNLTNLDYQSSSNSNLTYITLYNSSRPVLSTSAYIDQNTAYVWACVQGSCYRFTEPFTPGSRALPLTQFNPIHVAVDVDYKLLYTTDGNNLYKYQLSNLSNPIMEFRTLAVKVLVGCEGDFWIIQSNVLIHYPFNSTTSDYNITSNLAPNEFSNVRSAQLNYDCSVMWVTNSDRGRILKFYNPPFSIMNSSLIINAPMTRPWDLALDESRSRLWYVDYTDRSVISGVTSNISPPQINNISNPIYNCSFANSTFCFVSNPIFINSSTFQYNYTTLFINSSIVFLSNSTQFYLDSNQNLVSSQNITFAGNLTIHILPNTTLNDSLSIIQYQGASGQFSSVVVTGIEEECTEARVGYGAMSLELILARKDGCGAGGGLGGEGLSKGAIAGIVVGVVFGMIFLVVGLVVVVGGVVWFIKHRGMETGRERMANL
eukprot:TRINITY_DN4102_c0_g1_i2.p1 TRINITY_DN4102_c0_g1~~TRINITY_DN4102_c0_g1_i2.p1  ORF type:complete len:496 (+),score=90.21 TRINITY_DN4102_c0_g1_i2:54-1541(+)